MLNELAYGTQVYLVTGYTDLRRSIDGLAAIVQGQLQLDPFCKGLFLFCGRRCDRIKGLLWEGDGFLLLYKRLDKFFDILCNHFPCSGVLLTECPKTIS